MKFPSGKLRESNCILNRARKIQYEITDIRSLQTRQIPCEIPVRCNSVQIALARKRLSRKRHVPHAENASSAYNEINGDDVPRKSCTTVRWEPTACHLRCIQVRKAYAVIKRIFQLCDYRSATRETVRVVRERGTSPCFWPEHSSLLSLFPIVFTGIRHQC